MLNNGSDEFAYQVINCALTAWHMIDWTYHELGAQERARFPRQNDFRDYIKQLCGYMVICREIADGTKHAKLTHKHHPTIGSAKVVIDIGQEHLQHMWMVDTGNVFHDPKQIMRSAEYFWRDFLRLGVDRY